MDTTSASPRKSYHMRYRRFLLFLACSFSAMSAWFLARIIAHLPARPTFWPLVLYVFLILVYTTAYMFRMASPRLATSPSGIFYKCPEFSLTAKWTQIQRIERDWLGNSVLVIAYPIVKINWWFGWLQGLWRLATAQHQVRVPIGRTFWEEADKLEQDLSVFAPQVDLDAPRR